MIWWVTGAAGFIGTNLVMHLLASGHRVVAIDDVSREGSEINAAFLEADFHQSIVRMDISNPSTWDALARDFPRPDAIAHLAGQVSFLSSIEDPRRDFEINALGTLNALEFLRQAAPEAALIGMSSNKVYGDLSGVRFVEGLTRYEAPDYPHGFDESLLLDFHGPYGCSKGTADQYLADYGRIYGLRTISLRQSSVYGPHQHPRSDQGWVAHLVGEAKAERMIQLNGVGKQVRDLLHAADLAVLIQRLGERIESGGAAANVGGGPANSLSILELFDWISSATGTPVSYQCGEERPSDQKVFVSNNTLISAIANWSPEISLEQGLSNLWSQG